MNIGTFSAHRHYFEDDDIFLPQAEIIINMYEEVSKRAFKLALNAISNDSDRQEAAVYEAAAITLETLLCMYDTKSKDEKLDMSNIRHFAQKFSQIKACK